jgi:hypothetical protein
MFTKPLYLKIRIKMFLGFHNLQINTAIHEFMVKIEPKR